MLVANGIYRDLADPAFLLAMRRAVPRPIESWMNFCQITVERKIRGSVRVSIDKTFE